METQVAGLFSRFLKESKFKSVKKTDIEKEAYTNADDEKHEANAVDHDTDVEKEADANYDDDKDEANVIDHESDFEKEADANVDDEEDHSNAVDHETNEIRLNKAACNEITFFILMSLIC